MKGKVLETGVDAGQSSARSPVGERSAESRPEVEISASDRMRIRHILVPTDFSDNAGKALEYALAFARQFGARLTILHVVEPVTYPVSFDYGVSEVQNLGTTMQEEARDRLRLLLQEQIDPSITALPLLRVGSAWQEIVQAAAELHVDLIVLATHGYTGVKHVLLGSTSEKVVRHAPCPVLTVRAQEHDFVT